MKTHYNLLLVLFLFSIQVFGESNSMIKGRVLNVDNKPVEFATAAIINAETKELVKGEVCNEKGEFIIDKIKPGDYILSISMVGFVKSESEKISVTKKSETIEKTILLKESFKQLSDVVVIGKRQFIEQSVDKMIVNPEASITLASENVYEILKKVPGVLIDNNDNITLKGMQGVKVLIDEKPTYVSAQQLTTLLKGMQGKNIDRIEIIENPSARYDAEGNSGIINIKTRHNKAPGFNGSINTGLTLTRSLGENAGLDLNMNYGKLNIYGNYNFYDWKGWNAFEASRRFTQGSMAGAYQLINKENNANGNAHNYKIGADFFLRKNHVLSFMYRVNTGFNDNTDIGDTKFTDKFHQIDSTLTSKSVREFNWDNKTANINYKWDIDTTGQSLTMDADYAYFKFYSTSDQVNKNYNSTGIDKNRDLNLLSSQNSDIYIYSFKMDYTLPINKVYRFESGLKSSIVNTDNVAKMNGYLSQNDNFKFEEYIQAAYINGKAQYSKTALQVGLRLENTISKGNSVLINQVDKNSYLKLFPSIFIQQNLKPDQTIGVRYSYRIGRPSYHDLNPFLWLIDPYTYNQGNPSLEPQFTHSVSLNHNYKGKLMTNIGYNYTNELFTEVLVQNDETKTIYQTMDNLSNAKELNLSETLQLQPAKWWQINATGTGMYKEVNSELASNAQFKRWSFMGNLNNSFTLPLKISMELSANYMSKQLVGNFTMKSRYNIDFGIQRRIFNDKGTIKLAISDIFNTGSAGAYTKYGNIDLDFNNKLETRRLNFTLNYRFGKDDLKNRSNRSTASSEEASRSNK